MKRPFITAEDAGKTVPNRDVIWSRLCALPEGDLFLPSDITQGDAQLEKAFHALQGHDHIHMVGGYHSAIVETRDHRMRPRLELTLKAYMDLRKCVVVEAGDRLSWRLRIRQWEPLEGHRYYSSGPTETFSNGQLPARVIHAPAWLLQEDDTSRLLRVFHDTPEKDLDLALRRTLSLSIATTDEIRQVIELAMSTVPEETHHRHPAIRDPRDVGRVLAAALAVRESATA